MLCEQTNSRFKLEKLFEGRRGEQREKLKDPNQDLFFFKARNYLFLERVESKEIRNFLTESSDSTECDRMNRRLVVIKTLQNIF